MKKSYLQSQGPSYPAPPQVLLGYIDRLLLELPSCRRVHYSFMDSRMLLKEGRAANFRFRLTWVFDGNLCTSASFEKKWERRYIRSHELFLSGTGGWDVVDIAGGDCKALAILYCAHHTRIVFSEFKDGKVGSNPYYHTSGPDSEISRNFLDALNLLMNEPEEERRSRVVPFCQALLEQLVMDVRRDDSYIASSGNLLVSRMMTMMQNQFHLPVSCSTLCGQLQVNRCYASDLFHRKTGQTIKEYLLGLRLEKAEWLLSCYDWNMEEIARQCGFSGANYFIRVFREKYGMSPGEFRKRRTALLSDSGRMDA